MKPDAVHHFVEGLPYMMLDKAWLMYNLIQEYELTQVLELGCYHGVSTTYLAGAVSEFSTGRVVTIDLESSKDLIPNVNSLLDRAGLAHIVKCYFEPTSYNWRLMKFIEAEKSQFDFCFIDGGHTWYSTGFAFFLVEKLLARKGWLVFDDYDWDFKEVGCKGGKCPSNMPEEERITKHIQKVIKLLVLPSGRFGNFSVINNMAFLQKL